MAETKVKVVTPDGRSVDGVEVPIRESSERWSEFVLEDGSVVRSKLAVMSFTRVDGEFDPDGNPVYITKATPLQIVVNSPEALRQKAK